VAPDPAPMLVKKSKLLAEETEGGNVVGQSEEAVGGNIAEQVSYFVYRNSLFVHSFPLD
jgi:hypothetical protein